MNALSKILTGAIVATTVLTVACGKKNSGTNNGVSGAGCIQIGSACVAPGTPGFGGTFEGTIGGNGGGYFVKIKLRNAGNGGGWGGGFGGGFYGQQPQQQAQAIMEMSIQSLSNQGGWSQPWGQPVAGQSASGRGQFVNGGAQIRGSDGYIYQVAAQFTGNQMNVQITGGIQVAGVIYQVGQQNGNYGGGFQGVSYGGAGYGGGYGGGGYGGGGWVTETIVPSAAQAGFQPDGYWGF